MTLHELGIIIMSVFHSRELRLIDIKELAREQIPSEDSDFSLTAGPMDITEVRIVRTHLPHGRYSAQLSPPCY